MNDRTSDGACASESGWKLCIRSRRTNRSRLIITSALQEAHMQAGAVAASHAGVWDPAGKGFVLVVGSRLHIWHTTNVRAGHSRENKKEVACHQTGW